MVSPALERVARDLAGRIKLVKVDVDAAPRVAQRFSVQAVPTLLLMKDGQVIAHRAGAVPAASDRRRVCALDGGRMSRAAVILTVLVLVGARGRSAAAARTR